MMTTQSAYQVPSTSLLRNILLANIAFSGISGFFLLAASRPVSEFLGLREPVSLSIIGIVLLLYAPLLLWIANDGVRRKKLTILPIFADFSWVVGSAVLIFTDLIPLTTGGKWAIAIVADIVLAFAILQLLALRREV